MLEPITQRKVCSCLTQTISKYFIIDSGSSTLTCVTPIQNCKCFFFLSKCHSIQWVDFFLISNPSSLLVIYAYLEILHIVFMECVLNSKNVSSLYDVNLFLIITTFISLRLWWVEQTELRACLHQYMKKPAKIVFCVGVTLSTIITRCTIHSPAAARGNVRLRKRLHTVFWFHSRASATFGWIPRC